MDLKQTLRNLKFHPDVPKSVRSHLSGSNHSARHKFIYGCGIMCLGVGLVKGSSAVDSFLVHYFADVLGYLLHGIGAIPIVKSLEGQEV